MKKIIIVLLCLSSLLCFARKCDDCGYRSELHMYNDGPSRKICFDCHYKKSVKKSQENDNDLGDFDDFDWGTIAQIVVVSMAITAVCKIFSKKHSSPRNSFRNNKVDKKSTNTIDNDFIRLFADINDEHIFLSPNIPAEKLSNAIKSYAPEVKADDVILLVDDTCFGGAKDGMIITQNKLFSKALMASPVTAELSPRIKIQNTSKAILIDGEEFCTLHMLDRGSLTKLVVAIREMCKMCEISSQNADNCNQNTAENVVNRGAFVFSCPQCNCKLESDTEWTGMECECPLCHKKIVIPQNSTNL